MKNTVVSLSLEKQWSALTRLRLPQPYHQKPGSPEYIVAEEQRLTTEMTAKLDALRDQRRRENERRHPLNKLLEERKLVLEAIERNEARIVYHQREADEYLALIRTAIDHAGPETTHTFWHYANNRPNLPYGEILVREVKKRNAELKANELPAVESRIREYAKAESLEDLLPTEMQTILGRSAVVAAPATSVA